MAIIIRQHAQDQAVARLNQRTFTAAKEYIISQILTEGTEVWMGRKDRNALIFHRERFAAIGRFRGNDIAIITVYRPRKLQPERWAKRYIRLAVVGSALSKEAGQAA